MKNSRRNILYFKMARKLFASKTPAIFFCCALFACTNPFVTREPEKPDVNVVTFENPFTPEIVFENFKTAIESRNVENYIRNFIDTSLSVRIYEFVPDQNVALSNPGSFVGWGLSSERAYLSALIQATPQDSAITLSLLVDKDGTEVNATSATFSYDYSLIVKHIKRTKVGSQIKGRAIFMLEPSEDGEWAIYRWEDFRIEGEHESWSDLKARF